jgi:hypothetical protein
MVTILHRVALTSYVLIAAQGAPAGSSGISGTVRDLCGFVTPGATVSAVNRDGIRADTTTDASGRYVLRVGPGTWTLSFELRGFRQQRQDLVITTPDNNIEVNIRLALARPTEMITPHSPRIRYERYAMQGVVRGDDGAGIPQAIIRLRPKRTAQFVVAGDVCTTDSDGGYFIVAWSAKPIRWRLSVEAGNYRPYASDLDLAVGETKTMDIRLKRR